MHCLLPLCMATCISCGTLLVIAGPTFMPVRLSAAAFPGEFAKSQVRPENLQEMLDEWEVTDATSIIGQNLRTRSAENKCWLRRSWKGNDSCGE